MHIALVSADGVARAVAHDAGHFGTRMTVQNVDVGGVHKADLAAFARRSDLRKLRIGVRGLFNVLFIHPPKRKEHKLKRGRIDVC